MPLVSDHYTWRKHRGDKNQINMGPLRAGAALWERVGNAGEHTSEAFCSTVSPTAEHIAACRVRQLSRSLRHSTKTAQQVQGAQHQHHSSALLCRVYPVSEHPGWGGLQPKGGDTCPYLTSSSICNPLSLELLITHCISSLPPGRDPHIAPADVSPKQASTGTDSQDTGIPPEKYMDRKEPQSAPPAAHSMEPLSQRQRLLLFCPEMSCRPFQLPPSPGLPLARCQLSTSCSGQTWQPPLHPPTGGCSRDFGCRGAGPGHSCEEHPPTLPKQAKVHTQDKGKSSLGFFCKRYETA